MALSGGQHSDLTEGMAWQVIWTELENHSCSEQKGALGGRQDGGYTREFCGRPLQAFPLHLSSTQKEYVFGKEGLRAFYSL